MRREREITQNVFDPPPLGNNSSMKRLGSVALYVIFSSFGWIRTEIAADQKCGFELRSKYQFSRNFFVPLEFLQLKKVSGLKQKIGMQHIWLFHLHVRNLVGIQIRFFSRNFWSKLALTHFSDSGFLVCTKPRIAFLSWDSPHEWTPGT